MPIAQDMTLANALRNYNQQAHQRQMQQAQLDAAEEANAMQNQAQGASMQQDDIQRMAGVGLQQMNLANALKSQQMRGQNAMDIAKIENEPRLARAEAEKAALNARISKWQDELKQQQNEIAAKKSIEGMRSGEKQKDRESREKIAAMRQKSGSNKAALNPKNPHKPMLEGAIKEVMRARAAQANDRVGINAPALSAGVSKAEAELNRANELYQAWEGQSRQVQQPQVPQSTGPGMLARPPEDAKEEALFKLDKAIKF